MKKKSWALLLAAVLAVGLLAGAAHGAEETAPASPSVYWYELEVESTAPADFPDGTIFKLYVKAASAEETPLHTGSAALGIEGTAVPDGMSFEPAEGYSTAGLDGTAGAERGVTDTGIAYLGFTWYTSWTADGANAPALDEDGRQLIGRLILPYGRQGTGVSAQDVTLAPWTETVTGQSILQRMTAPDADVESLTAMVENVWRIPDARQPETGFYQGFYRSDEDGAVQRRVDIRCAWQSLRVVSYDRQDVMTVLFYRQVEGTDRYAETAAYRMVVRGSAAGGAGKMGLERHGRVVPFRTAQYLIGESGTGTAAQPEPGVYKLAVKKQSHVTAELEGVTVGENGLFPELMGMTLSLPCGDVNGDGKVKQTDRAALTARSRYGRKAAEKTEENPEGEPYDLNGDGRIDQLDLAILTAPMNYGRSDFVLRHGDDGTWERKR